MGVEWVRYGDPAVAALRARIAAAKADDPLFPVTVVVPSNHVGVAARRRLASGELGSTAGRGSGVVGVTFLTVYRLADLLGAARLAAQGRRPVSTPVIAAGLRGALSTAPGIFAPVAQHPATETALVAAYRELREVSEEGLDRLASKSPRAADVVRLHRDARAHLEREFSDEEDLVASAIEVLTEDPSAGSALGAVVVYLPQRLSRHGASLLSAVADHTDLQVLAGTTGDRKSDSPVIGCIGRLLPDAAPAAETPRNAPDATTTPVSAERTRIITTSDPDEEVRAAVRSLVEAVRDGVPMERIAILYGTHQPYARLVHEHLVAAGIAHNGAAVVPLTARMAGRTMLGLLSLPAPGFRRGDVLGWLAGGRLRHRGRLVPVASWERVSREAGVVAGRDQWDRRLASFAESCEADAERAEADPDQPERRSKRLRQDAARARDLRDFVLELLDDLAETTAAPRGWDQHAAWALAYLPRLVGGEAQRSGWPLVEQKALERTERALDRLACLAAVEGPVSLEVFARMLTVELEADLGRVGRMGEGVLVGTVRLGVGLNLDLVVILGLAEGSFPAPVKEDSVLPDHEREATGGELSLRSEEVDRQCHELLATLAGARRHVLCVPRGDLRRSNERVPSRWVTEIASSLSGRRIASEDLARVSGRWLDHVASFDAGLRRVAFPATEQEYRLRRLLAAGPTPGQAGESGEERDPILAAGVEAVRARRSPRFTRFDGHLAAVQVPSPATGVTSATRLEGWSNCPFAYFVREILHVEPVENPEDRLQISPLDLGSLVHEVLERFIGDVLTRPVADQPGPMDRWSEADSRRLLEIARDVCDRFEAHGLVGRPIFWRRTRRRVLGDLVRFLHEDSVHRAAQGSRPVAAEFAFGLPGGVLGTVSLRLPDGRDVRFRGKADRLDVAADGTLEVVDYKTGKPDNYTGLSEDDPDQRGRRLQLAVYALAARLHQGLPTAPVRSEYWFTSARGKFRRIGYGVTPEVLRRVGATVGQMVSGIEAGVFPSHPTASSTSPFVECPYCDPDALGVIDLRRQIERKREDSALAVFFDLAEGPRNGAGAQERGTFEASGV